MIIASPLDYRSAAQRRLPRFLLDYIEGGAGYEQTLRSNIDDLQRVNIKQRILRNVGDLSLKTDLFGQQMAMPAVIAPIGLMGMCARRGEVQVAKAAEARGIPFTMSTVSVCSIEEVQSQSHQPIWFQLYVLKDRKFMKNALERAWTAGIRTLVFTVDMPTPGSRYRDPHSGMSGPYRYPKRILQAMFKPAWALNVGLMGRPHDLGNISAYTGKVVGLEDYIGWLANNFDPTIGWSDLEWIREFWKGTIVIKGILDPQDARDAVSFGADGIVVSNHGGRQLDGAASSARALPAIADAVGNDLTVLADSGVRSGLDIVRMLALGAKSVLLGRATIYALSTAGQSGVENLLDMLAKEMRVAMTLMGVNSIGEINGDNIFRDDLKL